MSRGTNEWIRGIRVRGPTGSLHCRTAPADSQQPTACAPDVRLSGTYRSQQQPPRLGQKAVDEGFRPALRRPTRASTTDQKFGGSSPSERAVSPGQSRPASHPAPCRSRFPLGLGLPEPRRASSFAAESVLPPRCHFQGRNAATDDLVGVGGPQHLPSGGHRTPSGSQETARWGPRHATGVVGEPTTGTSRQSISRTLARLAGARYAPIRAGVVAN